MKKKKIFFVQQFDTVHCCAGGVDYHPDSVAYFNELPDSISSARKLIIDDLVNDLHDTGNFEHLTRFWIFAHTTADNALVSLVNPTTGDALNVNNMDFVVDEGFYSDPFEPTSYVDTNAVLNTLISQNSACIGTYERVELGDLEGKTSFGATYGDFSRWVDMQPKTTADGTFSYMNTTTAGDFGAYTSSRGLHVQRRENNTHHQYWRNGVLIGTNAGGSLPVPAINLHISGYNQDGVHFQGYGSTQNYSIAFTGDHLVDVAAIYTSIQAFMTALGKQV